MSGANLGYRRLDMVMPQAPAAVGRDGKVGNLPGAEVPDIDTAPLAPQVDM
jgi:hypothetical protein